MPPKGISPLIATILLIAFVIAVGGILSGWLVSFTKERIDEARVRGETDIKCSYADIYVSDADWNDTDGKLSITAENTGMEDLSNFNMVIIYSNNTAFTINVLPLVTLSPGEVQVFYNDTHVDNCTGISQVIFKSDTCPNDARDRILQADIDNCS